MTCEATVFQQRRDHSAVLILGAGGHGKTTLANVACYDLQRRGYVVLSEEIQFHSDHHRRLCASQLLWSGNTRHRESMPLSALVSSAS